MVRVLGTLAGNTIRELIRSKLLYNLLFFAVLLIGASIFVAQLTIGAWNRIILDMGLAAIEVSGVLISVLIGVGLVAGEVERRTILPTLAKPVGRGVFVLGRYLGLVAMLAINVLVMSGALVLALHFAQYQPTAIAFAASFLLFIELMVVASFAVFFSSFTTPILATAFSLSLFLIGHLVSDLRAYGDRSDSTVAKAITLFLYRALPNLELLNLKAQAANDLPISGSFVATSALYGCAYAIVMLTLAVFIFQRRDLK